VRYSFAYNPRKDGGCLLPHLIGIMRIEILRNGRVAVSQTGGNIHGFSPRFNQARRVGMTEAMCIQSKRLERGLNGTVADGKPESVNAYESAKRPILGRCLGAWFCVEQPRRRLIGTLIRPAHANGIQGAGHPPFAKRGKKYAVNVERAPSRLCFRHGEEVAAACLVMDDLPLNDDAPRVNVDIIPR